MNLETCKWFRQYYIRCGRNWCNIPVEEIAFWCHITKKTSAPANGM